MNRSEFKRHMKATVHRGTGQTRSRDKTADSAEIERLTQEFLANGGEIDQVDLRKTRHVDLTWRNYAHTAMEDAK